MDQSEQDAALSAMATGLACGSVLPMALKTAIELDLLELIKKAGPESTVSASELAAQLPTNNTNAASMIDRILRLLSAFSVLKCSREMLPDEDSVEWRYSLGLVCKYFTKNGDGVSVAPNVLMNQDKVFMECWYHLKDAILEGGVPFNRAHGMSAFEYPATDSRFNNIFNQTMSNLSTIIANQMIVTYRGFETLGSLVDVGGGIGSTLNVIVSKYPSIKGINFDLPHVVKEAPAYPGIENIGGDMFVSVPKADAIFMKWICHDWSDAHCIKLLRNCYEAIPENGKVIVAERILPEDPNDLDFPIAARADVLMMAYNPGGKERTEKEFQTLAKEAGFAEVRRICWAHSVWIMEFHK